MTEGTSRSRWFDLLSKNVTPSTILSITGTGGKASEAAAAAATAQPMSTERTISGNVIIHRAVNAAGEGEFAAAVELTPD